MFKKIKTTHALILVQKGKTEKEFIERERERDIKGQVFSIQEGEQSFRSDKLFFKQPPQIMPAGGSPSARCFVYQSASIALRGHWSSATCHFPPSPSSYEKAEPLHPPPPPTMNHKIKVIISFHHHLLFPVPPSGSSFSVFSFMCFKALKLPLFHLISSSSSCTTLQTVVLFLGKHFLPKVC